VKALKLDDVDVGNLHKKRILAPPIPSGFVDPKLAHKVGLELRIFSLMHPYQMSAFSHLDDYYVS
jgi:hypothetical protein